MLNTLQRYGWALIAVALGAGLGGLIYQSAGFRVAFLPFFPAVVAASVLLGLGPGVFTTLLSAAIILIWFIDPYGMPVIDSFGDAIALVTFLGVGGVTVAIGESMRRSQARLMVEREQRAREAERFRAVFEQAAVGIEQIELDGRLRQVNTGLCQIVDLSADELAGRTIASLTHPEDWEREQPLIDQLIAGQIPSFDLEKRCLRGDGSPVWVRVNSSMVRGAEPYRLSVVQDIDQRKRAEQALRESHDRLEQRVAERTLQLRRLVKELTDVEQRERRRLAHLLHENLQQILVAAKLRLESMRGQPDPAGVVAAMALIDGSVALSRSLATDLSPPVLYDRGLGAALEWLARRFRSQYPLQVVVAADPEAEPQAEETRAFLFQAARELLLNVVKHAGASEARVRMTRDDGGIELTVHDDGRGCEPAVHNGGGARSGFGLFGIRQRVELMGGWAAFGEGPAGGCQVTLHVPETLEMVPAEPNRPAALPIPAKPTDEAPDSQAPPEQAIGVVIADDHPILRDGLSQLIGHEPDMALLGVAEDGHEAVDLAHRLRPDVVLMDIAMPRLDGVEATRRIVASVPGVRVIGLSMHEDVESIQAMYDAGAVTYLPKDQAPNDLLAAIRSAHLAQTG